MRLALVAACIAATPAIADDTHLLERDCMEAVGTMAYGPETYGNGVLAGVVLGYAVAHGRSVDDAQGAARDVASACRRTPGMTFGEALTVLDHGNGPSTKR